MHCLYELVRFRLLMKDYRLPNGQTTKSTARYIREWNKLSKPVAKALGCDIIGVDPSIHLMEKGCQRGFQISTTIAERIRALYLANTQGEARAAQNTNNEKIQLIPNRTRTVAALVPLATGYAEWRAASKLRLNALESAKWGYEQAIREINRDIDSVTEQLANGASGGTMWKRNLSFA